MSIEFSDTHWHSYDVDGDSLAAVADAILQMDEAAKTEWFPRYEYTVSEGQITSATVVVRTSVAMPRWRGYAAAPPAEKDEWDRFWAALSAHEQGRIELVVQHLSNIDEQLVGNSPAAAEWSWQQALETLKSASEDYDREADHGRNQRTSLDVSGAVPLQRNLAEQRRYRLLTNALRSLLESLRKHAQTARPD
ncbi:MAG TPA: DUF922 domain-containing protein [Terriglobia bacterium]|nr:DUF922 domain-containing protein [Terriglobia bacterium]